MHRRSVNRVAAIAGAVLLASGCAREVRVGAVVSRTGAAASYGQKVERGLELAAERANSGAGLFGPRVRLIFRDDGTRPEEGARAALDLIERDEVAVIIGAVSSAVSFAVAEVCEQRRAVMLSPTASAPGLAQAGEFVFRIFPSDTLEGRSMADFARDLGLRRLAVLATANDWGRGLAEVFSKQFERSPERTSARFDFPEGDLGAIDTAVAAAKAFGADGLFVVAYAADTAEIVKRARAAGVAAVILGTSTVTSEVTRLAGDAAENLVFPLPGFDTESSEPSVVEFVRAYRERYAEPPDTWAAHGYDALNVVLSAIEAAGSTDADEVRRALLAIDDHRGAAGRTAFDAQGEVVRYSRLWVIRAGESVRYESFVESGGTLPVPGR
jgi:branched-chain amino acid transport system substrate-binding protein